MEWSFIFFGDFLIGYIVKGEVIVSLFATNKGEL